MGQHLAFEVTPWVPPMGSTRIGACGLSFSGCRLKNIVSVFQWPRKEGNAGSFAWNCRCNRRFQLCITSLSSDPGGRSCRVLASGLLFLPNRRRLKPLHAEHLRPAKSVYGNHGNRGQKTKHVVDKGRIAEIRSGIVLQHWCL